MLELVERHLTSRARLLRLLDELEAEGWCAQSVYLTPQAVARHTARQTKPHIPPPNDMLSAALGATGGSDTGVAVFLSQEPPGGDSPPDGGGKAIVVCPPFPLSANARYEGVHTARLRRLLRSEPVVGIVLLRLRRYAVAVLRGDTLLATKTDRRYVKNRHRAGGQSQRRFERSRERLIRELYDKTCETARDVFAPFKGDIRYLMLGGEANTLAGLMDRCGSLSNRRWQILSHRLNIDEPNQKTLNRIAFEVWKSRVYVLTRGLGTDDESS